MTAMVSLMACPRKAGGLPRPWSSSRDEESGEIDHTKSPNTHRGGRPKPQTLPLVPQPETVLPQARELSGRSRR